MKKSNPLSDNRNHNDNNHNRNEQTPKHNSRHMFLRNSDNSNPEYSIAIGLETSKPYGLMIGFQTFKPTIDNQNRNDNNNNKDNVLPIQTNYR